MNKKFLNILVCSLLVGGAATSVVSCKDYDDDITELNTSTSGLSAQLTALQKSLDDARNAAAAAASSAQAAIDAANAAAQKGDKAEADAQNAAAQAQLAIEAANTAKADAIAEVISQLRPLIDAATSAAGANAQEIAKLAGRIDGIENGLSNIDLTDINKQLGDQAQALRDQAKLAETIQQQIAALDEYTKLLNEKLGSLSEDVKTTLDTIANVQSDLTELQKQVSALSGSVSANAGEIARLWEKVAALSSEITTQVSAGVNTIAGVISQRLTSVTLMPDLYIGGIPAISFQSAKYTKRVLRGGEWVKPTNPQNFVITNNETTAQYRLNPGTVTEDDIIKSGLAFVHRVATARAAEVVDELVNVNSATVGADGILTVKLGKSTTGSLNHADAANGKINTVALKVPIAQKHLFTEQGETSAAVYSEYTRLEERYFEPELNFTTAASTDGYGANHHMPDSTEVYNAAEGQLIAKKLVYNESYDLYKLVEGCAIFSNPVSHQPLTIEELRAYGMDIEFHKGAKAYTPTSPDATDQQKFVQLSGLNNSVLTPVSSSGVQGNQVIIGKQPIIAATLVDKNNKNVIDQKYLKVLFVPEDMEDVVIDWTPITVTGSACSGAEYDFTWQSMAELVLEKLNDGKGMSKEEFTKIYTSWQINPANTNNGTLTPNVIASNLDASIPVMTWTVDGCQLGKLKPGENSAQFHKTVTFVDPAGMHPSISLNLEMTVNTSVVAATLGKTDGIKWQNNTMLVYPVPMPTDFDPNDPDAKTAYYETNILEGRLKPYVNNLLDCSSWDVNYATSGNPAYPGEALGFPSGYGHFLMTLSNQANLDKITYSIANTQAGKDLVTSAATIHLDWSMDLNGCPTNASRFVFGSTDLKIVEILKLNLVLGDQIVDNSREQTINITNKYTLTDAFGNIVAKVNPAGNQYASKYYAYYVVQDPVYDTKNIKLADNAEGTEGVRTLESLNMQADIDDASGNLTFKNMGAPLQADAFIIVPLSIEHKWGKLKGHIAVPLKKKLENPTL